MGVAEAKLRGREADSRVQGRGKKVSLEEDGGMRVDQGRAALKACREPGEEPRKWGAKSASHSQRSEASRQVGFWDSVQEFGLHDNGCSRSLRCFQQGSGQIQRCAGSLAPLCSGEGDLKGGGGVLL